MVLVKEIDALLPQTQCGECGYSGCFPYAQALAQGTAQINQCPPGGLSTVEALGTLLQVDPTPYLALIKTRAPSVAVIREQECIGCTKCIKACPVDAIIGSAKLMHTVMTHECTGCGLCVAPCPVDCIEMTPLDKPNYDRTLARERFNAKQTRVLQEEHQKREAYKKKRLLALTSTDKAQETKAKQDYIQQALARVKAKEHP
jgi:electron transport complex protein RnfB